MWWGVTRLLFHPLSFYTPYPGVPHRKVGIAQATRRCERVGWPSFAAMLRGEAVLRELAAGPLIAVLHPATRLQTFLESSPHLNMGS